MSEELANLVRDMYDDLSFLREYLPKHIIIHATKSMRLPRNEMETKVIEIVQKLETIP